MVDTWAKTLDELRRRTERLATTRHNTTVKFKLEEVLLSTGYGSMLRTDEASVIASFLESDWATIEDLRVIGVSKPTANGLRSALYVDYICNTRFGDTSNFAYNGFRHALVTEDLWQPFLLSVASSNPLVLMRLFCSLPHSSQHSSQILKELLCSEVLEATLTSKVSSMNILGWAAGQSLVLSVDYVSKLKALVSPQFFNKLAANRQFHGLLPVHQCVAQACANTGSNLPTADFLRSLLPDDKRIAKRLDLTYVGKIKTRSMNYVDFVGWSFARHSYSRQFQATDAAIGLMKMLE